MSNLTTATTATVSPGSGDRWPRICDELDCRHVSACTPEALIERNREGIEQADREIIQTLVLRRVLSQRVGRLKAEIGLPYTDLSRERVVIESYTKQLGVYGASLAQDILRLSKGTLP